MGVSPPIDQAPSPNFGPRRDGATPRLIVLHYTAMPGGAAPVIRHFQNPEVELSAHYVIGRQGRIVQMVSETQRAWHAGAGRWGACADVNSASIGIEICNAGDHPFGAAQMDAVCALLGAIRARHGIPPQGVIGHSDLAPGRKIDPGARFDWRRLSLAGHSIWPQPRTDIAPDASRWRRDLRIAGYTAEVEETTLLAALRLRFRPRYDGPLDGRDMGLAAELARRWPVDADAPAV